MAFSNCQVYQKKHSIERLLPSVTMLSLNNYRICYFGKCMERKFRWFGSNQLRQTKSQMRTLKVSYKNAKENNNKTGASPIFSPHFHVFDEVLGTRDTVNLQHVLETIHLKMFKGTVVQIEKTVINVRLRVSKSSWKFRFSTIYNFSVMYQWNLLFL